MSSREQALRLAICAKRQSPGLLTIEQPRAWSGRVGNQAAISAPVVPALFSGSLPADSRDVAALDRRQIDGVAIGLAQRLDHLDHRVGTHVVIAVAGYQRVRTDQIDRRAVIDAHPFFRLTRRHAR